MLAKADIVYFNRGKTENKKFWSNLEVNPSFKGLKVLDIGCGHGSLCVDIAVRDAGKVIGIDLDKSRISFAKENVQLNFSQFNTIIEFHCCDICNLPETDFDVIVSKDSLEHILNLDSVFSEMKKRLKDRGRIYIGFGPLYNSPFGDHGRTKAILPWGHLLFSEHFLLQRLNKNKKDKISSIIELGLNKLSLAQYRQIFYNSGLRMAYFSVNKSHNPLSKLFSLIKRVSFFEEYVSHNIYCILEKSQ